MRSSFSSLWQRRHLLWVLVASNLKHTNRSSTLGFLWWFLDPMLMAAVYYIVVAVLLKRGGSNQPYLLFLVCGLFPWKSFSDSAALSVGVLKSQHAIIKSVSFPLAVLPLAQTVAHLVYFGFGIVVIAAIGIFYGTQYGTWPTASYLALPVVVVIQLVLTAGVTLTMSTIGLMFTDLQSIIRHVLRVAYYLSPSLYSIDMVPEQYRTLYMLNPFAGLMSAYREILMHGRLPSWELLVGPMIVSSVVFLVGYRLFRSYEGRFVQYL